MTPIQMCRKRGMQLAILAGLFTILSLVPPHVAIQRLLSPYYRIYSTTAVPVVGGLSLLLQLAAVAACLLGSIRVAKQLALAILVVELGLLAAMSGYGNGFWLYATALAGALYGSLDIGFWCLMLPPLVAVTISVCILRLPLQLPHQRLPN